jgi:hypothetical protein
MIPPTLAEMTAWSIEEVQVVVENMLPNGWSVTCSVDDQFFLTITDAFGVTMWSNTSLDERLLLLDAFGWLLLRDASRPKDGPWAPRQRELTHRVVAADAEVFADPPDLDSAVLDAVYFGGPGKPGHGGCV